MATKPGVVPSIWAPGATYTTGPFIGLSNKVPVAGAVANDGHRPGAADPTPAEYVNDQQNKITTWIFDWLSQGLATAAANTHIVETNADGRTEIVGIDVTDIIDRTVALWVAANTIVPAFILRTNGNGMQVENAGFGTSAFTADLSGGAGIGYSCVDGPADSGTLLSALLQGFGSFGTLTGTGGSTGGLTMNLTSSSSDTLILTNGGTGAPIRTTPQTPPAVLTPGQIWPDTLNDDLEFVSSSGSQQRVWSSEQGYDYTYSATGVAETANGSMATSFNYGFVAGKTYIIRYGFDFGRTLGSTRDVQDFFNVGGFGFPAWFGDTLPLFQGGPGEIEKSRFVEFEFTSPITAILLVDLNLQQTAGSGTAQIESSWISVTGAID